MVEEDDDSSSLGGQLPSRGPRRTFWRSASWSSRSHSSKARSCLQGLPPLSIARQSFDEWPKPGSDDTGEWPQPPTPSGNGNRNQPGGRLKIDLPSFQKNHDAPLGMVSVSRERILCFDKECSKVVDHIYLGGDAVARSRSILRCHGITHVLNCVGFVSAEYFKPDLVYKTLWLQDSPSEDITSILYDVFDYFEDVREQGGRVLVHCCQGVSRSASLVIAYLMWREGRSFDNAFQCVKTARGIANPNIGFACQLLQCQKRVHAVPLSPSSVLRMYRMAPHSPYDPLHVVPKLLSDPSPACLDSRGAFIIHVPSVMYVWIGRKCESVMAMDAKTAAFQVARYERVQAPIVTVEEGDEPFDFWDMLAKTVISVDRSNYLAQAGKKQLKPEDRIGVGKKRIDSYNVDFELFQKAQTGGFAPPFSQSEGGFEMRLPVRESNWSLMRRKYVSRHMEEWISASCGMYPDSNLVVQATHVEKIQPQPSDSSDSSRQDGSSDSTTSPNSSSGSVSPAIAPPSHLPSSASSLSTSFDSLSLSCESSHTSSDTRGKKHGSKSGLPLAKGVILSLGKQRREKLLSSMNLQVLTGSSTNLSNRTKRVSSTSLSGSCGLLEKNVTFVSSKVVSGYNSESDNSFDLSSMKRHSKYEQRDSIEQSGMIKKIELLLSSGNSTLDSSLRKKGKLDRVCGEVETKCVLESVELLTYNGVIDYGLDYLNQNHPLICHWPNLEHIVQFDASGVDPKSVLFVFSSSSGNLKQKDHTLYLWIGSCFSEHDTSQTKCGIERENAEEIDWIQVGCNFLSSVGLPKDASIQVVKEKEEPDNFLELLSSL